MWAPACPLRQRQPPRAAGDQPTEQPPVEVVTGAAQTRSQQQLEQEVQLLAARAHNLEGDAGGGGGEAAAALLSRELERLEQRHGRLEFELVPLRQLLWDLFHSLDRHQEARAQAQAVHDAVVERFGDDSAEAQLVAVRLGVSTAACGDLEGGMRLMYGAAPVLQFNANLLMQQAASMAEAQAHRAGLAERQGAAEPPVDERMQADFEALQDGMDKVAAALGEANVYGALATLRHAARAGQQQGVVQGWEELEAIVDSGFGSLLVAAEHAGGGGPTVPAALREHDRLVEELSSDALLGRLVQAQNARLHDMAEQGLDHPLFQA